MALRNIEIGVGVSAFLKPERKRGIVIDVPILLATISIAVLGFIILYSAVGENSSMVWHPIAGLTPFITNLVPLDFLYNACFFIDGDVER